MWIKYPHPTDNQGNLCHSTFAYPLDVDQVFFVEDKINKGWCIVVPNELRNKKLDFYRGGPSCTKLAKMGIGFKFVKERQHVKKDNILRIKHDNFLG